MKKVSLTKKAAGIILPLALAGRGFSGVLWSPGEAWGALPPAETEPVATEGEIAAQGAIRDELNKKKQEYDEIAKQKSQEAEGLSLRIESLRQAALRTQAQIEFLQAQTEKLRKSAAALDREIASLSFQVDELVKTLRTRLVGMYKYDAQEGLFVLFGARNAHEALESAYLAARLARQNQKVVDELLLKTKTLDRAKLKLKQNRAQLTALSETLSARRAQYEASVGAAQTLLSSARRDQRRAENAAQTLERVQQSIDRTVLALLERKKTRAAMEREAGVLLAPKAYTYLARGALLDWPLRGPIAVPYGFRVHAALQTKSFSPGIDIRAASGAAVKAAGPGEVLFGGRLQGFGYAVVIDHGREISTVYTRLSSALVEEGDAVQAGTPLGRVGSMGEMGGYGFHFEVRVEGAAEDPLNYLKKF
jgi:murein DD-endopeptidase MepM/ murein hydrolase activator NlpD